MPRTPDGAPSDDTTPLTKEARWGQVRSSGTTAPNYNPALDGMPAQAPSNQSKNQHEGTPPPGRGRHGARQHLFPLNTPALMLPTICADPPSQLIEYTHHPYGNSAYGTANQENLLSGQVTWHPQPHPGGHILPDDTTLQASPITMSPNSGGP